MMKITNEMLKAIIAGQYEITRDNSCDCSAEIKERDGGIEIILDGSECWCATQCHVSGEIVAQCLDEYNGGAEWLGDTSDCDEALLDEAWDMLMCDRDFMSPGDNEAEHADKKRAARIEWLGECVAKGVL